MCFMFITANVDEANDEQLATSEENCVFANKVTSHDSSVR